MALGFRDDERDYSIAAHMLASLGVQSVRLMTNNPRKVEGLRDLGVDVVGRIPLVIPANEHNRAYLATKARKSGHLLGDPGLEQQETIELVDPEDGSVPAGVARDGRAPDVH